VGEERIRAKAHELLRFCTDSLVRHLVQRHRTAAARVEGFRSYSVESVVSRAVDRCEVLRCCYCGYNFTEVDLPLDCVGMVLGRNPAALAPCVHPKRLRDWVKPVEQVFEDRQWSCTKLEIDHVVPRASLGDDSDANLVVSCAWCNRGKSAYRSHAEAAPLLNAIAYSKLEGWTSGPSAYAFYAILDRERSCAVCGADAGRAELTVRPESRFGLRRIGECATTCYSCL
jgi:hypothetical protein